MIPIQFPSTLGLDFSGVVEKIGGSSVSLKQGDEVYEQAGIINGSSGAFAEMALANGDSVVHKPKSLNHQQAAGLPLVGGGIIVSMLEQPDQELMDQFGVKAVSQFTQANRERLTKLGQWVDQNNIL